MTKFPDDERQADAIQLVLDTMLDAVVVLDRDGMVIGWNEVATQIFGWSSDEALHRPMVDLIVPPHHVAGHSLGFRRYQKTGVATVLNRRIQIEARHNDGRVFAVELAIVAAPGTGRAAFIGFLRDISAQLVESDRLALSEESLRLATEAAEIGTWDLDLVTNELTWSDRTKAMFGISPGVPCSMDDFYAGLHPADREEARAAFSTALDPAVRATYDVQYRTIGKEDGQVRWVAAKGQGRFDATGRCVRAVGTAIDITGRKRAEAQQLFMLELTDVLRSTDPDAALHQVSALIGHHFGVSRVGYGQLDPVEDVFDYDVCWTDGSVEPLLGRFPARAFGVKTVARLSEGETVVVDDLMADAVSDEAETRETAAKVDTRAILVVPFLRAGRLRTIVYLNDRPPRHWQPDEVMFMQEVAERTRQMIARGEAEAALHAFNATLEARVEERTAELRATEAVLRQSQKMEAVGQLTGGVAHDFNNLLTVITGSLDLAMRRLHDGSDPRLNRLIDNALKAAGRAGALTQRLLAFARRQALAPHPTDPAALVNGMIDLLSRSLGETISIQTQLPSDLWWAHVDANQLENSILNLAVNARDAMTAGGVVKITADNLRLETATEAVPPGDYILIEISDTGSGMPPEVMARVFEPFFTTKEVGKGTGLGLSMVHGFIRQSGGDVRIRSVPGEGTSVTLQVPRAVATTGSTTTGAGVALLRARPGEVVLVVEDDKAVRDLSARALEELGYEVIEASNGPAALDVLAKRPVSLLFSDVVMPTMSGAVLAEAAAALRSDMPILLTSGYTRSEFSAGSGVRMLAKPFTLLQLAEAVRKALDGT